MRLTTEDGTNLVDPDIDQLKHALSRLGMPGNGFAILEQTERSYIQTSGSRADGYVVQYREGSEERHFSSERSDVSHKEMVELFVAYSRGGNWKGQIRWKKEFRKGRGHGRRDSVESLIVAVFFAIGIVFLSLGIYLTVETTQFLSHAVKVPGTVVDIRANTSGRFRPVVKYLDHKGRMQMTSTSTSGSITPSYYVDQNVVVLYDPTDVDFPLHAKVMSFSELWMGGIFMIFGGIVFAVMSVAYWWFNLRRTGKGKRGRRD